MYYPFRGSDEIDKALNTAAAIISAVASVLTLLIAILLYNKYGIENTLLEKNTATVFAFLEELKSTSLYVYGGSYGFQIELHNIDFKSEEPHELKLQNLTNRFNKIEDHYEDKLIFSWQYIDGLKKLLSLSESPFMPKNISDKVQNLKFTSLSFDLPKEEYENYSVVDVKPIYTYDGKYGRFNLKDISLFEYLNKVKDVKVEIINWIRENSSYFPDLNL